MAVDVGDQITLHGHTYVVSTMNRRTGRIQADSGGLLRNGDCCAAFRKVGSGELVGILAEGHDMAADGADAMNDSIRVLSTDWLCDENHIGPFN